MPVNDAPLLPFAWDAPSRSWLVDSPCGWRIQIALHSSGAPLVTASHAVGYLGDLSLGYRSSVYDAAWAEPASAPAEIAALHRVATEQWTRWQEALDESLERLKRRYFRAGTPFEGVRRDAIPPMPPPRARVPPPDAGAPRITARTGRRPSAQILHESFWEPQASAPWSTTPSSTDMAYESVYRWIAEEVPDPNPVLRSTAANESTADRERRADRERILAHYTTLMRESASSMMWDALTGSVPESAEEAEGDVEIIDDLDDLDDLDGLDSDEDVEPEALYDPSLERCGDPECRRCNPDDDW